MHMQRYLYRGVNSDLYEATGGKLVPKAPGAAFKQHAYFGGEWYFGDGSVFGDSERNAVIQHQRNSAKNPGPGVSTTPSFENAKVYATHAGKYGSGYIFKIDTELLQNYEVSAYVVAEHATLPAIPGDEEVILVAEAFAALPTGIVVEVVEV
jgi:hypothetical protein